MFRPKWPRPVPPCYNAENSRSERMAAGDTQRAYFETLHKTEIVNAE